MVNVFLNLYIVNKLILETMYSMTFLSVCCYKRVNKKTEKARNKKNGTANYWYSTFSMKRVILPGSYIFLQKVSYYR